MSNSFTQTKSTSWFTRLKNALSGIVAGILFVIAATGLLFWNEGRAVKTATALAEGAGLVQTIDPNNIPADAAGKLVHFSGELIPTGIPQDTLFPVVAAPQGALRLERNVEMYQWEESTETKTVKKLGGSEERTTTYTYSKKWSDKKIDSSSFKEPSGHENPPMSVTSETFGVESGVVGQVKLTGSNISGLGKEQPLIPDDQMRRAVQQRFGNGLTVTASGAVLEVRTDPQTSTVGDLRISYSSGDADIVSAIGQLDNNTLIPFATSNGRTISMFREGAASARQMFDDAISNNTMWTWMIRFGGFVAMVMGFKMVFSIVGVLGDVVPFIGNVFRFATGLAAFAIASVLSTMVIGIAWIYYRPVLGFSIIGIGLLLAGAALYLGKSKARQSQFDTNAQPV